MRKPKQNTSLSSMKIPTIVYMRKCTLMQVCSCTLVQTATNCLFDDDDEESDNESELG